MTREEPEVLEFCNRVYEAYREYQRTESLFKPVGIAVAYRTERMLLHKAVRGGMVHVQYVENEGHVASIYGLRVHECRGVPEGTFMLLVERR